MKWNHCRKKYSRYWLKRATKCSQSNRNTWSCIVPTLYLASFYIRFYYWIGQLVGMLFYKNYSESNPSHATKGNGWTNSNLSNPSHWIMTSFPKLSWDISQGEKLSGRVCTSRNLNQWTTPENHWWTGWEGRTQSLGIGCPYCTSVWPTKGQLSFCLPTVMKTETWRGSYRSLVLSRDFPTDLHYLSREWKLEACSFLSGSRFGADNRGGHIVGESTYSLRNYISSPHYD